MSKGAQLSKRDYDAFVPDISKFDRRQNEDFHQLYDDHDYGYRKAGNSNQTIDSGHEKNPELAADGLTEPDVCWKPDWEEPVPSPDDVHLYRLERPEPYLPDPDLTDPDWSDGQEESEEYVVRRPEPRWGAHVADDSDFHVVPELASVPRGRYGGGEASQSNESSEESSQNVDSDTEELVGSGCLAALDQHVPNYVPEE